MCDDKYFKVTNTRTGEVKCYKRAASIVRRFEIGKNWVFDCLNSECLRLHLNGDRYRVETNNHPECQRLRRKIKRHFGRNPSYLTEEQIDKYRHLIEKKELGL